MWPRRHLSELRKSFRALPVLARDFAAAVVVLAVYAATAALPLVTVPAATLVLLPVLLAAALVFGRDSALLAALLTALAARFYLSGPSGGSVDLLAITVLSGAALAVAALLEELRRRRGEAEDAYLRSDATARRAAERVEAARQRLRQAEARLAEAERQVIRSGPEARAVANVGRPDPALDSAFKSEGGI